MNDSSHPRASRALLIALSGVVLGALSAPGAAADEVQVLYAGSLVNFMERGVGPAFERARGEHFRGYAAGSSALANQIKGHLRRGDVFISAVPKVNEALMGESNGDWVSWYVSFAESPLMVGYSAASRFASDFQTRPWYQVLMQPGLRIGRTDPRLDPKGALTLTLMQRAAEFYRVPDLAARVLGSPDNPAQVLPEESLVGRLQSGELDAGFFYSTEAATSRIPAISLPAQVATKAEYTVSILRNAPDPQAAEHFVTFLLGPQGRAQMQEHGLALREFELTGSPTHAPATVRAFLHDSP
jgi:molybdate/tungstate transport system substrate-binding protein